MQMDGRFVLHVLTVVVICLFVVGSFLGLVYAMVSGRYWQGPRSQEVGRGTYIYSSHTILVFNF